MSYTGIVDEEACSVELGEQCGVRSELLSYVLVGLTISKYGGVLCMVHSHI